MIFSTLAGAWLWHQMGARPTPLESALISYPEPRDVADFRLTDHNASEFRLSQISGHWSLLFFGFTSCPDICPDTLLKMHQLKAALADADANASNKIKYYFVSVDPERDTAAKMATYLSYFDPEITGLTGDPAILQALVMQMGVAFYVEEHEPGAQDYGVDHSAGLVLMNPRGQLHGIFRPPHTVEDIATEFLQLLKSGG